MEINITLSYENEAPEQSAELERLFNAAALAACAACGVDHLSEVSLLFTDDAGIRELNRDYRGKDASTDVLSFAMGEDEDGVNGLREEAAELPQQVPLMLGDIVISHEHAAAQAAEYGHSLTRETVFLFTHGMLHLLGYDHERSAEEEKAMFALQEQILEQLGLPR